MNCPYGFPLTVRTPRQVGVCATRGPRHFWASTGLGRTQRAGKDDRVAFQITQPALPVGVLTAMARFDDLSFHLFGTRNRGVEIVQFKPKENTIAIRPKIGIPEWTVMVLDIPIMQLKDQGSI